MNPSFKKPVVSSRRPAALAVCAVLLSACGGGSGSSSAPQDPGTNESNVTDVATVPVNDGTEQVADSSNNAGNNNTPPSEPETVVAPADSQPQTPVADISGGSNPVEVEASAPAPVEPTPVEPAVTQVEFNIMVPAYVSDSLQVQVSFGDVQLSAGWVVDETWSVSSEFPSDTENPLSVNFTDGNGAVVLGNYETTFRTSTSPTQTVEIFADQFDTASYDADGDGMSNLDEAIAGTDPLTAPPRENTVRTDFDIIVPVYVSDTLQVRLEMDENWSATYDFPADAEGYLTITFLDRNGDLPLGDTRYYYRASFDTQTLTISADWFNTRRFDNDRDGVSNYREQATATDPLVSDSSVPVNFSTVAQNFTDRCSSCHSRFNNNDGGLYERLMDRYVTPFEPEESRVVRKMDGSMFRYAGVEMAELVRAWVLLGATEE